MDRKTLTIKQINGWLKPWPLRVEGKRRWVFEIWTLRRLLKLKNPNKLPNLGRVSFEYIAKSRPAGIDYRYVNVLVHDWLPTAKGLVVIVDKGIVWDGSHRLIALAVGLKRGMKVLNYVGVLRPDEG